MFPVEYFSGKETDSRWEASGRAFRRSSRRKLPWRRSAAFRRRRRSPCGTRCIRTRSRSGRASPGEHGRTLRRRPLENEQGHKYIRSRALMITTFFKSWASSLMASISALGIVSRSRTSSSGKQIQPGKDGKELRDLVAVIGQADADVVLADQPHLQ